MSTSLGADENLVDGSTRQLGEREIGALGFGCWRLVGEDTQSATALIAHALELGMTLIDNADVYGLDWGGQAFGESETLLGRVLRETPALRQQMVLASKGAILPGVPYVANSAYLNAACEASLARLNSETIDLYQIHRPDMFTHPQETAEALDGLVEAGKIAMVGVSNHTQAQVHALRAYLKAPLVSLQNEYSVANLDMLRDGTLDLCMETDLTPLAWSPLAGGALISGDGQPETLLQQLDALAARENVDRAAIALAFILAHPANMVAIIGSQSAARLSAAAAAKNVTLTRADVYSLIEASEGIALP